MSVVIGVALSCTASFMNALGLNLTRMSSGATTTKRSTNAQCLSKFHLNITPQSLAFLGVLLSSLCGVVDVMSYGYAPQSTLAPLGSFTLVVNLLLAPLLHDERINLQDATNTFVIVSGVVLCILSSSQQEEEEGATHESIAHTPNDLYNFSMNPSFRTLLGVVLSIVLLLAAHVYRSTQLQQGHTTLSTGFVYPVIAGMLGGSTVLCAKILTTLLSVTGEEAVDTVRVVLPLAVLCLCCAVSQMVINAHGLSKHSSLVMVPIYSSSFVLSNAVGGGVFFQEFAAFNAKQWWMYGGGVAMVVGGVLSMAVSKMKIGGGGGGGGGGGTNKKKCNKTKSSKKRASSKRRKTTKKKGVKDIKKDLKDVSLVLRPRRSSRKRSH